MPKFNIISLRKNKFSSEAKGVLETMLNVPEYDYITIEELHEAIPADTLETIRIALDELIDKKFIIKLGNGVYAVNKRKIPQMQII